MKQGTTFKRFGCTWIVDRIYTTNEEGLWNKTRFTAHVVESPDNYEGMTEIDAALHD